MTITKQCGICFEAHTFVLSDAGYAEWQQGQLIQRALPELSDDQRELLISGICGKCFDGLFAGDKEAA